MVGSVLDYLKDLECQVTFIPYGGFLAILDVVGESPACAGLHAEMLLGSDLKNWQIIRYHYFGSGRHGYYLLARWIIG